jgi:predicted phosphodiesterase
LVERDIKIFHGTINSMYEYFIEYIENGSVKIRENDYLEDQIRAIKTKYVGFGHSHIERVLKVNNQILLNPGSVGLPAYSDDEPKHKMETLNNKAKYIEVDNDKIVIHYIEYDYMRAAKEARKNKRDDWAHSIETGRAL